MCSGQKAESSNMEAKIRNSEDSLVYVVITPLMWSVHFTFLFTKLISRFIPVMGI
jgi:hypothetical protein